MPLQADVRAYVENEGERWSEQIEREHRVPLELWDELRDRGYLTLAAPVQYGGGGIPFTRYLELLELFSMSHASLRMIVHVAQRHLAADGLPRQRRPARAVHQARGGRRDQGRVHADRAGRRQRRRHPVQRGARGRHLLPERREASDHVRDDRRLPDDLRAGRGHARDRRHRGADGHRRTARASTIARWPRRWACAAPTTATSCSTARRCRWPTGSARRARASTIALGGFLGPSRISLATTCVGLAQRALDLALDYARQRETFGKKIAERQAIAFKLAEIADRRRGGAAAGLARRRDLGAARARPDGGGHGEAVRASRCSSA